MERGEFDVVAGAFGYTGRYIAQQLIEQGRKVRTLTNHPGRGNKFGDRVSIAPLNFQNPEELVCSLRGAATLYNTYWVRFRRGSVTFEQAVENTKALIHAAGEAGVCRIVHISITNASEESPRSYFRGKGLVERAVIQSGVPYAIIRPTVVFGVGDILLNNIAWLLRSFPIFAVPGAGDYRLQPVFVEDVAELAVGAASGDENVIIDAAGPEAYTFEALLRLMADRLRRRVRFIHLRPGVALGLSRLIGWMVRDVVLTAEEVAGLMGNLLVSKGAPTGRTRLSE